MRGQNLGRIPEICVQIWNLIQELDLSYHEIMSHGQGYLR